MPAIHVLLFTHFNVEKYTALLLINDVYCSEHIFVSNTP